jgi:pantoate--beta-alanine ligase
LHAGHLSLVAASNAQCDVTVVTIFVNPTQFGPHEDLENYPRQLDSDVEALSAWAVDLVFAPTKEQMYGAGRSTMIEPPAVAEPWDGRCRPGHFSGVLTIVLKLFHIVPADVAYFGTKDFQQLQVVRAMVRDLNVPVRIVACPTVRDADGLAMSSRNVYLSDAQRSQALSLSRGLSIAAELFQQGERRAAKLAACIRRQMADAGISRVDYVALVEPDTLAEVFTVDQETVALVAAYIGATRLIDNRRLGDGPIPVRN